MLGVLAQILFVNTSDFGLLLDKLCQNLGWKHRSSGSDRLWFRNADRYWRGHCAGNGRGRLGARYWKAKGVLIRAASLLADIVTAVEFDVQCAFGFNFRQFWQNRKSIQLAQ